MGQPVAPVIIFLHFRHHPTKSSLDISCVWFYLHSTLTTFATSSIIFTF